MRDEFESELEKLLTYFNYDTKTNTPSFLLAEKIKKDLESLATLMEKNIEWHSSWRGSYIPS